MGQEVTVFYGNLGMRWGDLDWSGMVGTAHPTVR